MRIYHRKLRIIKELIEKDDFVSSESLAKRIGVSSRTIRDDIKQLTAELLDEGITLFSIPGKGYSIRSTDKQKARNFLEQNMGGMSFFSDTPESRVYELVKILLFADKPVTLDEIAEALYVSRSTAEKDLGDAEKWLASQKLILVKKTAVGIQVAGSEIALRYAMVNCLLEQETENGLLGGFVQDVVDEDQVLAFQKILLEIQHAHKIFLSDVGHKHLILYLCIALYRVGQGNEVQCPVEEVEGFKTSTAYRIADQIADMTLQTLGSRFCEPERAHLAQYLMQTHLFVVTDLSVDESRREEMLTFVKSTVVQNDTQYQTAFAEEGELVFSLVLYLQFLLKRKDHKIIRRNPSLHEIREEYPLALEMAAATAKAMENAYQVQCNQNEVCDIALYYCAAIERLKVKEAGKPRRAAIICSSGIGGSQLLAVKIKRYFPDLMVDGIFPAHRLAEALEKGPDFVVSTIPLPPQEVPVVHVSQLLNDEDFVRLRRFLDDEMRHDDGGRKSEFVSLFSPTLFHTGIDIKDRDGVIRFLCRKLAEHGHADMDYAQAVLERENTYSTAIGNLVAIPHALPGQSSGSQIVVGILKKPVLWGEEFVQLVFLLNIEGMTENRFKGIFENLFDVVNAEKTVKRLLKADRFEQFMREMIGTRG